VAVREVNSVLSELGNVRDVNSDHPTTHQFEKVNIIVEQPAIGAYEEDVVPWLKLGCLWVRVVFVSIQDAVLHLGEEAINDLAA
jgi:hypothetical protein